MNAIISFACMIGIGVTVVFAWALRRAAGCADDQMEVLIEK